MKYSILFLFWAVNVHIIEVDKCNDILHVVSELGENLKKNTTLS